jgi:hypothetical protein
VSETAEQKGSRISVYEDNEIIRLLKQDIASGKNWYIALLEAIGRWTTVEETIDNRTYRYLIAGEAFDWLLLAERLCQVVDGLIPENDKIRLLFFGKAPVNLSNEEFQTMIGESKYRQYLNFFYGVTVEEALFLTKQEEVRKERTSIIAPGRSDYDKEVYTRIYGSGKMELLNQFRKSKGYPRNSSITLSEMKEFTYWLFKYRLENSDRSRVASDTKKAMEYLQEQFIRSLNKK